MWWAAICEVYMNIKRKLAIGLALAFLSAPVAYASLQSDAPVQHQESIIEDVKEERETPKIVEAPQEPVVETVDQPEEVVTSSQQAEPTPTATPVVEQEPADIKEYARLAVYAIDFGRFNKTHEWQCFNQIIKELNGWNTNKAFIDSKLAKLSEETPACGWLYVWRNTREF